MRAAAACIKGVTFKSILMRAVFKSPLVNSLPTPPLKAYKVQDRPRDLTTLWVA